MVKSTSDVQVALIYMSISTALLANGAVIFSRRPIPVGMKLFYRLKVSLAFTDVLRVAVGYLPEILFVQDIKSNGTPCHVIGFFNIFLSYVAISHIMLLLAIQCIDDKHHSHWHKVVNSNWFRFILVVFAWFYGLLALFPLFGYSRYEVDSGICSLDWKLCKESNSVITYMVSLFVFYYFLPTAIVVGAVYMVKKKLGRMPKNSSDDEDQQLLAGRKRAATIHAVCTLVMAIVFFAAWTPYACVGFMAIIDREVSYTVKFISAFLGKLTTCLNPLFTILMWYL